MSSCKTSMSGSVLVTSRKKSCFYKYTKTYNQNNLKKNQSVLDAESLVFTKNQIFIFLLFLWQNIFSKILLHSNFQ